MPSIQMRPVPTNFSNLSRMFDPATFEREWFKELEFEVQEHLSTWNKFTSTWKKKPSWKRKRKRGKTADEMYVQRTTKSKPFIFVEGGTRRMPRAYVHGFSPKTRPGVIQSSAGKRGYIVVHKGMRQGIEARNVRDVIVSSRNDNFMRRMRRASGTAARRAARFAR